MSKITRPLRGRKPNRRLPLDEMRAALRDRRAWTRLGVVRAPEGGGDHWRIVGENADILVEVELMPTAELVEARLMGGMYLVPDVGEEVIVALPEGDLTWMPTIVAVLSNASTMPAAGDQAPAPQRIVIARPGTKVFIHDGTGGAKELAYKTDVEAVDAKYAGHKHLASGSATSEPLPDTTTVAPIATGGFVQNPPNPAFPGDPHPFLDPPWTPGTPTFNQYSQGTATLPDAGIQGTSVLLAK